MHNTTKVFLFALILFGQFAFATSPRCYQGTIGDANFDGFSAPDAKVTILFAGPSKTSAIAISAPSLGRKGRVNGEFNAGRNEKNEIHGTLVPDTGELNLTVDEHGVVTHVQPRGKFMANRKTDDSENGVLGTVFGDWGAKIELKPVTSIEECKKTLYGPLSEVKVNHAAPAAAAPVGRASTAPEG